MAKADSKAEPWLQDPLSYLIAPTNAADFLARIYENEALIVPHNNPKHFDGLLSSDVIDRIVTNVDMREGQIDMANASRTINRSDYVDPAGYIDRGAVADHYRGGATIILNQAHQYEPALARFCRALEIVFSSHVQTNIYLTPPNAQGFKTHYDNHDVFVLQVEGEKDWRLYDVPIETPFRGERFENTRPDKGELRQEFKMNAGDVAYVPRGMMHDAVSNGTAPSLHITVGLITKTWADLMLEAISEVALKHPEFRKSLPPGYANTQFDRTEARKLIKRLGKLVADDVLLDPAMDLMADDFVRSRAADNRGAIRDAIRPIKETESFKTRPHAPFRLAEDGERLVLIAPGGEVNFSPRNRPALETALSGIAFKLADLGEAGDAHMIYRLLAYGVIARV
jgi:ribosomal protein L16 Arg81 hydroxylase